MYMDRIVLHVDVNNAFLSWTACYMLRQGSRIDIRDRYAVIGGDESKRKGIVLAKSNLCKSRGVITGEPIYYAKRKCPYLEVYSPNTKIYKYYSDMMYNYLKHYNIPVTVVCTKMDKVTKKNQDKNLKLISKTLGVEQQELIPFSTITKVGKQEIYNKLMEEIEL